MTMQPDSDGAHETADARIRAGTVMNRAKGDAKVAAMATLVALADQRMVRDGMMQQSEMMSHMMSMQAAMTAVR